MSGKNTIRGILLRRAQERRTARACSSPRPSRETQEAGPAPRLERCLGSRGQHGERVLSSGDPRAFGQGGAGARGASCASAHESPDRAAREEREHGERVRPLRGVREMVRFNTKRMAHAHQPVVRVALRGRRLPPRGESGREPGRTAEAAGERRPAAAKTSEGTTRAQRWRRARRKDRRGRKRSGGGRTRNGASMARNDRPRRSAPGRSTETGHRHARESLLQGARPARS